MSEEAPKIEAMTFEDAMKELERVVGLLESGDAPLEKSIELYERGAKLKAHCEGKLSDAELKVSQITQASDGSVSDKPARFE